MATLRAVSARRLHALFQHAREPIFLLDSSLRFVFQNRAWEDLTGRTSDMVSGLVCQPGRGAEDGPLDALASAFCPPAEALQGQPTSVTVVIPNAAGQRLPSRIEFWPLLDSRGRLVGLLGFVRALSSPPRASESPSFRLRAELAEVRERLRQRFGSTHLVGSGSAHRRLLEQVSTASSSRCPVLIRGETGSGKRLVARLIHQKGEHANAPFLMLDVAALTPLELEQALFSDPAGPGTGPIGFEPGSSVAIGDVVNLPRDVQKRLCEALEDPRNTSRILALTACDPDLACRDDRLREDLYFALTTLVIRLQPLRARLDDLPLLAQEFLEQVNARHDRRRWGFEPSAIEALRSYDWPGNLSELARVVEAAHARGTGDLIAETDLPAEIRGALGSAYAPPSIPPPVTPLDLTLETVERRLIEQALTRSRRNKSKAAELLDISRPRLYRRIKELKIPDDLDPSSDGDPS